MDGSPTEDPVLTAVSANIGSPMSTDSNHNDQPSNTKLNGLLKELIIKENTKEDAEETRRPINGINFQDRLTVVKKDSKKSEVESPDEEVEVVVVQKEEDDKIQEYLQRSDTAVIYAEPVGQQNNGKFFNIRSFLMWSVDCGKKIK